MYTLDAKPVEFSETPGRLPVYRHHVGKQTDDGAAGRGTLRDENINPPLPRVPRDSLRPTLGRDAKPWNGSRVDLLFEEPHELVPEILVVTQVLLDDRALGVEDERGWHPLRRELLCERVILVPNDGLGSG